MLNMDLHGPKIEGGVKSIGLMHDAVLLINFTTKPHIQNANVSQRIGIEKNTSMKCGKSVQKLHGSEAWG